MDIQQSRYDSYLNSIGSHATNKKESQESHFAIPTKTEYTDPSPSPVKGNERTFFDANTQKAVMDATQKADEHPLAIAFRNDLDDIARDPAYAAKQAELLGTRGELFFMDGELPPNGSSAEVWTRFTKEGNQRIELMKEIQKQRSAYYDELSDQGRSGADIYAKILEFNANLPDSYADKLGWSTKQNGMSYSEFRTHQLEYLQNAMQSQASTA